MSDASATRIAPRVTAASDAERCAICGHAIDASAFCHFYRDGHKITFCSPACAEVFLQRGASVTAADSLSDSSPTAFR